MRRYSILLAVALVALTGLPADQPASVVTVEADLATRDPAAAAPLDTDVLRAISLLEAWLAPGAPAGPTSAFPAAWAQDCAVLPTGARAPPHVPPA